MEKKVNLKEMNKKDRASYIWDYYKWYMIVGALAVAIIVYFIVHYATVKETVANVLFVNADPEVTAVEDEDHLFDDFLENNGYDMKKQTVGLNNSLSVDADATDGGSLYTYQSLLTILAAGGADVYASDEAMFQTIAEMGNILDISTVLSEEELASYGDRVYYVTDPETDETYPCGIVIDTENEWISNTGFYPEGCVIGIVNGNAHPEAAAKLFTYILGE